MDALIQRWGRTQVEVMKAQLKEIEAQNPDLFKSLVCRAIEDSFELPIPQEELTKIVMSFTTILGPAVSGAIGVEICRATMVRIVAEALF